MSSKMTARHRPLDGYVKSSASDGGGQCVLVRRKPGEESIFIRDSKFARDSRNRPEHEPVIEMPASAWVSFRTAVLCGDMGSAGAGHPSIEELHGGEVVLRGADGTALAFTPEEWAAFRTGLAAGEFDSQPAAA